MNANIYNISKDQKEILDDAYEAYPYAVFVNPRRDNHDHEALVDYGYLKRNLLKSGFNPEYTYTISMYGVEAIESGKLE